MTGRSIYAYISLGKKTTNVEIAAVTFSPSLDNHQTHRQHPIREYEHGSDQLLANDSFLLWSNT